MQGQINPTGHRQGSINPTGNLQGTMSTESLIGGQVVGMRGLKGDKGDKGDTGEQGERGYGITSIVYNADKTITITYADGETVTTDVLQGEKGDTGDKGDKGDTGNTGATGNGIASAVLNTDYTLTFTFTNGTTYTTPSIRGQQGAKGDTGATGQQGIQGETGETGNGIASISKAGTSGLVDMYTITFTDGTTTTFTVTNGQNGEDGQDGQDGEDGFSPTATVTKVGKVATITITDKDGTTTTTVRDGEDGQGSGDMLKSTYDTDNSGVVDSAESVAWSGVTGKPSTFPPSTHNHDEKYYTKTEADGKFALISAISDMATKTWVNAQGFITSLAGYATEAWVEAKGYLTEHQSLSAYRTSAQQDAIDDGKADAVHTHDDRYYTESEVDSQLGGKVDKVSGKGLSSNDYTTTDKNTLSAIASGYRTIFVSTEEPTSAQGNDGDVWIKYGD